MFLKKKKGSSLIATYVVLIVLTFIAIAFVTGFSTKIWRAIFPSDDKSTLKSFEAVRSIIMAKSVLTTDYDSTSMSVYLKNGYMILLFEDNEVYGDSGTKYYAPKDCQKDKRCLCLYKKEVVQLTSTSGDEKDVIKCYNLDPTLDIDSKYLGVDGIIAFGLNTEKYTSYLFIRRVIYPQNKAYLYILPDTDENRAKAKEWSIPVCKTTEQDNLCYGKREGDTVVATDAFSLGKILYYCQNKEGLKYNSMGVRCEYPPDGDECDPDCTYMESKELCKYNTCEEYNNLIRDINYKTRIRYLDSDNYVQYSLCEIDASFCNVNNFEGCIIDKWQVYACKDSPNGAADDPKPGDSNSGANEKCTPPWKNVVDPEDKAIDCKIKFLEYEKNRVQFFTNNMYTSLITSYDETNTKCKEYMDEYFYEKTPVMTCKQGKNEECKQFIDDKAKLIGSGYDCELKFIKLMESGKETYWLTHYSLIEDECKQGITTLFTTISLCRSGTLEERSN